MHIVLLILKILLIIVLSLIGLALGLVLLVLLAPVRYRFYIRKQDDIWAKLTARWLGFVLCFKLVYDQRDGICYRLRLFGGTLFGSDKPWNIHHKEKVCNAEIAPVPDADSDISSDADSDKNREINRDINRDTSNDDVSDMDSGDIIEDFPSAEAEDKEFLLEDKEFDQKSPGLLLKIGQKIDAIWKKIIRKYTDISDKLSSLKKKKDGYTKLMNNVRTKEAIRVVKKQVIAVLNHLKPSRIKGQVEFGTGDPASTGKTLGYMSVLFPLYYDHIDITPNFEDKILKGDLIVKGRIRLWTLAWCAVKVIMNKNVRITISRFKKISGGK